MAQPSVMASRCWLYPAGQDFGQLDGSLSATRADTVEGSSCGGSLVMFWNKDMNAGYHISNHIYSVAIISERFKMFWECLKYFKSKNCFQ